MLDLKDGEQKKPNFHLRGGNLRVVVYFNSYSHILTHSMAEYEKLPEEQIVIYEP